MNEKHANPDISPSSPPPPGGFKGLFKKLRSKFKGFIDYTKKLLVDRRYLELYFSHLIVEFDIVVELDSLPNQGEAHKLANRAKSLIKKWDSKDFDWRDIFELEAIILQLQPLDTLQRRAWNLRQKYKQIVTQEAYDAYLNSKPPGLNGKDGTEAALRADLLRILRDFHWQYGITITGETLRDSISIQIAWILAGVIALGVVSLVLHGIPAFLPGPFPWVVAVLLGPVPSVIAVFLAGVIGGFVSTELRLQELRLSGTEPIRALVQLNQGRTTIVISPLLGGVFAVILFVIFAGGFFLKGDLIPVIYGPPQSGLMTFETFWTYTGTASTIESAKLLIWSFIAGFAERLVPDALNRIAASTKSK